MFRCYTLTKTGLAFGIRTSSHDCILSDEKEIRYANIHMLPVLPYAQPCLKDKANLSLSFLTPDTKDGVHSAGSIVSADPRTWKQAVEDSPLVLLDPRGSDDSVLLFLPHSRPNLLSGSGQQAGKTVGTTKTGYPAISDECRARTLLEALNLNAGVLSACQVTSQLPTYPAELIAPKPSASPDSLTPAEAGPAK